MLSHPLTLLLVGGVLTSLVVPGVTRSWQDHEKALAVKSALVEDLTLKTTRFLAAIQFARASSAVHDAKAVNKAYKQFLVDSAVLGARISARFPDGEIAERWSSYVRLVELFYALGGPVIQGSNEDPRAILARYTRTAKPLSPTAQAERNRLSARGTTASERDWLALYGEVLGQRDAVAHDILVSDEVAI